MLERKKLNKLVVMTLQHSNQNPPKASQLYDQIRQANPDLMREETVRSFRGFVKVLNSFEQVQGTGTGVKKYMAKSQ